MSQLFTDACYNINDEAIVDLQNMENNFQALKTSFSGTSAPTSTSSNTIVAGQRFFSTTAGHAFQVYNQGGTAWRGIPTFGYVSNVGYEELWVYSNSAIEGWVVDGGISDCVLALQGGTYGVPRTLSGSWTTPSHVVLDSEMGSHLHYFYTPYGIPMALLGGGSGGFAYVSPEEYVTGYTGGSTGHTHGADGTPLRPQAAVGVLIYPGLG